MKKQTSENFKMELATLILEHGDLSIAEVLGVIEIVKAHFIERIPKD